MTPLLIFSSAFDTHHWLEPRDLARQAGPIGRVDDGRDVFVSAGGLFSDAARRGTPDDNAAARELVDHLPAAPLLQRLMPAHAPAGAMARRPERSRETVGCSHEDVRRGAHGAADQDGLPDRGKRRRQIRMAWPERSRRTLAMHEEPLHHGADSMRLDLARVVRDVV